MKKDKDIFDSSTWDEDDAQAGFTNKPIMDGEAYVRRTSGIVLNIDWDNIVCDPLGYPDLPKERVIRECINCTKKIIPKKGKKFCSESCRKQLTRLIAKHEKERGNDSVCPRAVGVHGLTFDERMEQLKSIGQGPERVEGESEYHHKARLKKRYPYLIDFYYKDKKTK